MKYITNSLDFCVAKPSAITFGKFDGLHKGHEYLIHQLLQICQEKKLFSIAFSFDIPPKEKIIGHREQVLTTNEERRDIFEQTGIDYLIECPFTPEVMTMEPETFIAWIVTSLSVRVIVTGEDFRFGYQRSGDYHTLQKFESKYGYHTLVVKKLCDESREISSSYIRESLSAGDIRKVNRLLGYPYTLTSRVIHGRALGRTIGIPTINMSFPPRKLLPPNGVYVTRVCVDGIWYKAVTNVGRKPTVGEDNPIGVETYIIDFDKDLYDQVITVCFLDRIREERRFESLSALQKQMQADIAVAEHYSPDEE